MRGRLASAWDMISAGAVGVLLQHACVIAVRRLGKVLGCDRCCMGELLPACTTPGQQAAIFVMPIIQFLADTARARFSCPSQ